MSGAIGTRGFGDDVGDGAHDVRDPACAVGDPIREIVNTLARVARLNDDVRDVIDALPHATADACDGTGEVGDVMVDACDVNAGVPTATSRCGADARNAPDEGRRSHAGIPSRPTVLTNIDKSLS